MMSPFDGLGYPDEHFSWCMENGLDAHAITEHGNFNSYAHAQLWVEKWNASGKGKQFKYIPGIEAYFHPSLKQWQLDKELADQAAFDKKAALKIQKQQETLKTKIIARVDSEDETEEIETTNALTIENEDETKSTKHFNPVNRRHHLVILPKNQDGLLSIFEACSKSYLHGFYRFPRMDFDMLREAGKSGNIIATSACLGGFPSWAIFQEMQKITFDNLNHHLLDDKILLDKCVNAIGNVYDMMTSAVGRNNYFLELQFNKLPAQNLVNRAILEFARRTGTTDQLVVTCDSHYHHPDLWKERELYKKLGFMNYTTYSPDSLPKSKDELKCELYPKNASQIWDEYLRVKENTEFYLDDEIKDAIERSYDIAHNLIGEVKPDRSPKFPNQKLIPPDTTSFNHLVTLCKEGMIKRGLHEKPEYIERLKDELSVIKTMKNSDYFISYQKIMELSRDVVLVGPARGSGGGSLVNYVLYITDLDPVKWDLPFSRFLSIYRQGAPDIDTDLSDRDKALEQLRNFFGFENVVPISNYNTFKVKSLVKDVSKFYGIPFEEVNAATKTVDDDVRKATVKQGDDKNLFVLQFDDAYQYSPPFKDFIDKYPHVSESIKVLFKQNRSLGRHAGGVLIADNLPSKMPLITSGGEPQSPWVEGLNFKHLEYIGNFIKYDLLGLETLRLIERTIELILRKQGVANPTFKEIRAWYDEHLSPDKIDFDDPKPYEVYEKAKWCGIFQLTSQGAQRLFVKAKPKNIIDIAALTSIYRPGPLAANVDNLWLKHSNEPYDWGHPLINETLKETRGLLVFQEGIMALANKVSGFPLAECDEVRRAILKRNVSAGDANKKKVQELEDSIVNGATKNGVPESVARKMYETICFMSGYGFNKSHAVAYAIDSYWCAWLLTYYEDEWVCAYMESMSNSPESRAKAFSEVKSLGYQIVPIDINLANTGWTVLPGKRLMPSMTSCKGVGDSALEEILQNRPYTSIESLLWDENFQWKHSKFNKRALESLIKIGAFDSMEIVGEDKIFKNYNHMYQSLLGSHVESITKKRKGVESTDDVELDHSVLIKRSTKSDPHEGLKNFYNLVRFTADTPEWTPAEKAQNMVDVFGTLDIVSLIDSNILSALDSKGIKSIDDIEADSTDLAWMIVVPTSIKKGGELVTGIKKNTKTGKEYIQIFVAGPTGKSHRVTVWGSKEIPEAFSLFCAEVKRDNFGISTSQSKLRKIK
jgi:DNA polymerase-3 subunit alpha